MNDVVAYRASSLREWVERLPDTYYIVGDCAFPLSNRLLTPYSGLHRRDSAKSTFNYCLSQSRTKIEQTFGRNVSKWRRFHQPLAVGPSMWGRVVQTGARLHNYVIDQVEGEMGAAVEPLSFPTNVRQLGYMPTEGTMSQEGSSAVRTVMLHYIASRRVQEPAQRRAAGARLGDDDDSDVDMRAVDEDFIAAQEHAQLLRAEADAATANTGGGAAELHPEQPAAPTNASHAQSPRTGGGAVTDTRGEVAETGYNRSVTGAVTRSRARTSAAVRERDGSRDTGRG
eukprot:GHVU01127429.1.p1 GENE.GHVU01127429.1~~GHVU01127429.1.p1  ORF type:complete len:284 (+),score=31.79 GHVU01127429.1:55-906(+)